MMAVDKQDSANKPGKRDEPAPAQLGGRSRRTREQAGGGVAAALLIAIFAMVNYVAYRNYERLDLTSEGLFTLSPKSKKVLSDLTEPIDIYLFMARGEGSFQTTDELLQRYKAASPEVRLHYVDPEREPAEFAVLAKRYNVATGPMATGEMYADVAAVVARGEKNWHVNRDDLVGLEFGPLPGEDEVEVNVKAEQALTGAILQVISGRPTKVCVSDGHGEWSLEEGGERSLAALKDVTRHDNLEWEPIATLGKKEIPEGCDAVLVIGPQRAFSESEAQLLDRYLAGGGNLLLALDPVFAEGDTIQPTGFEGVLRQRGVRVDPTLVLELDQAHLVVQDPTQFLVTDFNDHTTTRAFQGLGRVLLPVARSISPTGDNDSVTVLMRTTDQAFGEVDLAGLATETEPKRGPGDLSGPLSLAVALRVLPEGKDEDLLEQLPGGRLIVIGDADFLQPALLQDPSFNNFHLFSAFAGWLTKRDALIEIPPKKVRGGGLVMTQDDLFALGFRVVVLLPGAALLCGIGVWLSRRN